MILKDTATFQVLFVVSLFCAVEINSRVHLLKSYIRQVPLFTSGGLNWSCYFGLGLGLKNLVLFTSLLTTADPSLNYILTHSLTHSLDESPCIKLSIYVQWIFCSAFTSFRALGLDSMAIDSGI